MKKPILWGIGILAALVLLSWVLMAANIISLDIQREATQHSQPYVETKVSLLHKLVTDWYQLDAEIAEIDIVDIKKAKTAQQVNLVNRIKSEAELIPYSQVPDSIKTFIAKH